MMSGILVVSIDERDTPCAHLGRKGYRLPAIQDNREAAGIEHGRESGAWSLSASACRPAHKLCRRGGTSLRGGRFSSGQPRKARSVFRNRKDAGRQLAAGLAEFEGQDCVILALPRGGVPVAAEVAAALHAPLDLLLVRKIGAPWHPELAVGAVIDGGDPITVRDAVTMRLTGTSDDAFEAVRARELHEIERRRIFYLGSREPVALAGRIAIVVDDGLATGNTMRAALMAARRRGPALLVMAVPVAPAEVVATFQGEADRIVCLEMPEHFGAVGNYYEDFEQTGDEEVIALLARYGGGYTEGENTPAKLTDR
jgi:predicted phosphoribosyltransferase